MLDTDFSVRIIHMWVCLCVMVQFRNFAATKLKVQHSIYNGTLEYLIFGLAFAEWHYCAWMQDGFRTRTYADLGSCNPTQIEKKTQLAANRQTLR